MSIEAGSGEPVDRRPGWPDTFFADELRRGLDEHMADYRRFLDGPIEIAAPGAEDVVADARQRLLLNKVILDRVKRILEPASVARAFGTDGETADEDRLAQVAHGLSEVFASLVRWGLDVRAAEGDPLSRPVYQALANFAREPLRQLVEFAHLCQARAEALAEDPDARAEPSRRLPPLALAYDELDVQRYAMAMDAAKAAQPAPVKKKKHGIIFRRE